MAEETSREETSPHEEVDYNETDAEDDDAKEAKERASRRVSPNKINEEVKMGSKGPAYAAAAQGL